MTARATTTTTTTTKTTTFHSDPATCTQQRNLWSAVQEALFDTLIPKPTTACKHGISGTCRMPSCSTSGKKGSEVPLRTGMVCADSGAGVCLCAARLASGGAQRGRVRTACCPPSAPQSESSCDGVLCCASSRPAAAFVLAFSCCSSGSGLPASSLRTRSLFRWLGGALGCGAPVPAPTRAPPQRPPPRPPPLPEPRARLPDPPSCWWKSAERWLAPHTSQRRSRLFGQGPSSEHAPCLRFQFRHTLSPPRCGL